MNGGWLRFLAAELTGDADDLIHSQCGKETRTDYLS